MSIAESKIGFLFPGQGSQYTGMGRELYENFRLARDVFECANDTLALDIRKLCFEGSKEELQLTENTQPAILTMSMAALRVLEEETDIRPSILAGHSLGEYSALVTAHCLGFEDALRTVRKRGQFMQEAVPDGKGAMAAIIGLGSKAVEDLCKRCSSAEIVAPANYNTPEQTVISGHRSTVDRAIQLAKEMGAKKAIQLPVSAPFHCSLMATAGDRLAEILRVVTFGEIQKPVVSNVEAIPYPSRKEVPRLLVSQVSHPVRWAESMEMIIGSGVFQIIEIGPKKVLSGLMKRIDPSVKTLNLEDMASLRSLKTAFHGTK